MKTHRSRVRAGATFMNRGALESELCHFYDSSTALFLSKHFLELTSVDCAPQCVRESLSFSLRFSYWIVS